MILVDTSAWIEFLRNTGSAVCARVGEVLGADLASCDLIWMEVLAGARNEFHLRELRGLLARTSLVPTYPIDYEDAAALYRTCRRSGETVHKLIDCLTAAAAIGAELSRPARRRRLRRPRPPHRSARRRGVGAHGDHSQPRSDGAALAPDSA